MLFFLFGPENFLALRKLRELQATFTKKNPSAVTEVFDFEENVDFQRLRESFSGGGGLFSTKKLIIIKNIFSLPASKTDDVRPLIQDCMKDNDLAVIVFEREIKDKRGKFFKFLKANAKSQEFLKLEDARLRQWIAREMDQTSDNKVKIDIRAIDELILLSKGNLWKIHHEIEKLASYKAEGEISVQDVDMICPGERETKVFDLMDAIGERNKEKALRLFYSLKAQGEDEFGIFSMIVFQLRNLLKIFDYQQKGFFDQQALAGKLKMHPFVVKKTSGHLRNFPKQKLKGMYQLASDLDYEMKTGGQTPEEALVYFIAKA